MTARAVEHRGSSQLAAALRLVRADSGDDWPTADLPDLLDAQLGLPAPAAGGRPWRVALSAPPALSAIIALKDEAKGWIGAGSAMPAEIARILYITAIASAALTYRTTISQLPGRQLAWHRTWALSQNWVDSDLLDLIRQWKIEGED